MGKNKNFYVIVGEIEKYKEAVEMVKRKYKISDFDIKIYDAEEGDITKFWDDLNSYPGFSQKKLLIIRNIEKLPKEMCEELFKIYKNPPVDSIIILFGSSVKAHFDSVVKIEKVKTPEEEFFSQIYSLKKERKEKLFEIIKDYMALREKNFSILISGIEIYFRNLIKDKKEITEKIIEKFENLYNLDYSLKVGRVEVGPELEIFLFYYFSI